MALQKTYVISIEMDEARKQLASAGKLLEELKEKTRAANQEEKDAKAVYRENVAALKELEKAQKALQRAREEASGRGADFFKANAALEKNIKQQAELNFEIDQSRTYYEQARASAKGAGDQQMQQTALVKQAAAAVKEVEAAEKARAQAAKEAMREAVAAEKARVQAAKAGGAGTAPATGAPGAGVPVPAVPVDKVKQLSAEVAELTRAWALTTEGTKEFDAALLRVAQKEAELAKLKEQLKGLDPRKQVEAFTQFSNGVVGAFTVATVAAESFGFSQTTIEQYEKKLLSFISVMHGVESISRAVNGSNLAVIKTSLASAKAWLFAGEAASTSAKVTRAAIASTGIGLLLVLIGTLYASWEEIKSSFKGSEAIFTRIGAVTSGIFQGLIAYVKETGKLLLDFFTGDVVGMVEDARNFGKNVGKAYQEGYRESIADAHRERIQLQIEANERLIAEGKAAGRDMTALEQQNQALRVSAIKRGTKEGEKAYLDALSAQTQSYNANYKKQTEEIFALDNARAQAEIARRQARGEQTLALELALKEREREQLLQAATQDEKAIAAKEGEIAALKETILKEASDREKALLLARLKGQIQLYQAYGRDVYDLQELLAKTELSLLDRNSKTYAVEYATKLNELRAMRIEHNRKLLEEADRAAIEQARAYGGSQQTIAKAEVQALKNQQNELLLAGKGFGVEWLALKAQIREKELQIIQLNTADNIRAYEQNKAFRNKQLTDLDEEADAEQYRLRRSGALQRTQDEAYLKAMKAKRDMLISFGQEGTKAFRDLQESIDETEKALRPKVESVGYSLVKALFGFVDEQNVEFRQKLNQRLGELVEAGQMLNDVLFLGAQQKLDGQLEQYSKAMQAAKERGDLAEKALREAAQQRASLEKQLDEATGSRREYLIQQIAKRRQEEAKAAREKRLADAEELRNARLKEDAERRRQKLERESQIMAGITATINNAAIATEAVKAGVSAVAGAAKMPFPASLPSIIAALAAVTASIASAKQLGNALGKRERGGLVQGPSHALGGIRYGSHEIEGLEFVTSRKATANNLKTLEQINQYGDRIEFIAVPSQQVGRAANGGQLHPDGSVVPGGNNGMVMVPSAQLDRMLSVLEAIEMHSARTAEKEMDFGPQNSRRIVQNANQEASDAKAGKLF